MNVGGLLTSAGVNIAICGGVFSLYSVLRKQPSCACVYFGQKLEQMRSTRSNTFDFLRLVPSASWIVKAWEATEIEIFDVGGLDAVVFLRTLIFSLKMLTVASIICLFVVLPLNYYGQKMEHKRIQDEPLIVFSIGNIREGSKCLWVHCLALYIISCCTCFLLYFEYKSIAKMRMTHIMGSLCNPSHFTVLVREIPWVEEESYSDTLTKFFSDFYASGYLSHQMVYNFGSVHEKLMTETEKMYHNMLKLLKSSSRRRVQYSRASSRLTRCGFCGVTAETTAFFDNLVELQSCSGRGRSSCSDAAAGGCSADLSKKECGAALVFFRTRYAALVASEVLQSSNPMTWVTDAAPEPNDIYWKNLRVSYRLIWIRKIIVVVSSILFVLFFFLPVGIIQILVHPVILKKLFPIFKTLLQMKFMERLITGYLPSVILTLFMYLVPPLMMFFSELEGTISRSGRKRSACTKILNFLIWNSFFFNVLAGAVIDLQQFNILDSGDLKNLPSILAKAVPRTATFFMTYVLTSGWAGLSVELIQPLGLIYNFFYKYILHNKDDSVYGTYTFPYHTEFPRVLLFGLLGLTCSIMAPLILPFLLVYFILAYLVYRNQILNVYVTKYQSGGLYWPLVHKATIFSLIVMQILGLGVFGLKKSPTSFIFTFTLIISTLLFNKYCSKRFQPIFKKTPAKVMIQMDRKDEHSGTMEEIHKKLELSYRQFKANKPNELQDLSEESTSNVNNNLEELENITTPS